MNEYDDFYSLIETSKECKQEFEKSNISGKEIFSVNLNNIIDKLPNIPFHLLKIMY